MNKTVNVAIQVLPLSAGKNKLNIIDQAINMIQNSGLKHKVCPFETVIEGTYDQVMDLVKNIQHHCLSSGTNELITNLKIQINGDKDVKIEDKMVKYEK